ncbi:MAG: hypothetical protein JW891_07105 [Candidatus Lokiarchaeota archaeon]|nr:hypothetical protein [Candidatus Lokiarchaeota archaeon]
MVDKYGLPGVYGNAYYSEYKMEIDTYFYNALRFEELSAVSHFNELKAKLYAEVQSFCQSPEINVDKLYFRVPFYNYRKDRPIAAYYLETHMLDLNAQDGANDKNNLVTLAKVLTMILAGKGVDCSLSDQLNGVEVNTKFQNVLCTLTRTGCLYPEGSVSSQTRFAIQQFNRFFERLYSEMDLVRSIDLNYNQLRIPMSDPVLYMDYLMKVDKEWEKIHYYIDFKELNDIILNSNNENLKRAWKIFIDLIEDQEGYRGLDYLKIKDKESEFYSFISSIIIDSTGNPIQYDGTYLNPNSYEILPGFYRAMRLFKYRNNLAF